MMRIILLCIFHVAMTAEKLPAASAKPSNMPQFIFYKDPIFYVINCLWMTRNLSPEQQFIYPSKDPQEVVHKLLGHLIRWARVTPPEAGKVVLWHNAPSSIAETTQNLLTQVLTSNNLTPNSTAPIELSSIETLDEVQTNPDVFSDKVPLYFRIDLLKAMIALYTLTKTAASHCVVTDLDIEKPLSPPQLFERATQEKLYKIGIVLNYSSYGKSLENQFHLLERGHPNTVQAIQHVLIDLNITRALVALPHNCYEDDSKNTKEHQESHFPQMVYNSYYPLFLYLFNLNKWGTLINLATKKPYETTPDFSPFGLRRAQNDKLRFIPSHPYSTDSGSRFFGRCLGLITTDTPSFPPPSLQYDEPRKKPSILPSPPAMVVADTKQKPPAAATIHKPEVVACAAIITLMKKSPRAWEILV